MRRYLSHVVSVLQGTVYHRYDNCAAELGQRKQFRTQATVIPLALRDLCTPARSVFLSPSSRTLCFQTVLDCVYAESNRHRFVMKVYILCTSLLTSALGPANPHWQCILDHNKTTTSETRNMRAAGWSCETQVKSR